MPSRFRTRATLIPPPPGSRWACAHRILVKGTIFLTDVERSTAGLMVRVTIWVNGISANAFNLRQAAQADECGLLVQNEMGRNPFEIFAEPPFSLKTHAKSGADEIFGHVTQNAPGNEYSAPRADRKREIAGDGAKHRAEHIDRSAAGRTATLDPGPGNLGSPASWQLNVVQRRESLLKIFQPVAGKNAFCRDMSKSSPQIGDDGVLPQRAAGQRRMAALARKHEVTGCVRYADRHSKACAGTQRRQGRPRDPLPAACLQQLVTGQAGQRPRDRFKIIDQAHRGKYAGGRQLGGIDHPGIVGESEAAVLDRARNG